MACNGLGTHCTAVCRFGHGYNRTMADAMSWIALVAGIFIFVITALDRIFWLELLNGISRYFFRRSDLFLGKVFNKDVLSYFVLSTSGFG